VECRCAVKKHILLANNIFEDCPHFRYTFVDKSAGAADVVSEFLLEELTYNEWAEQFQCHVFWQTTLIEFEFRTDDDN